jgi:hypothetical protein
MERKDDLMNRSVMWAQVSGSAMEHLHLTQQKDEIVADGMVLLKYQKDAPVRVHYTVRCDSKWIVREVSLHVVSLAGTRQQLTADGTGHWFRRGKKLAALDGCLDVDINVTPFTNTLPIRNLALKPGESAEINVVYITLPECTFRPARQRYTCLELTPESGRYKYESLTSGFTREITVDADGLVIDYPGIWQRV